MFKFSAYPVLKTYLHSCGSRINYEKYSTDKTKISVGFCIFPGQLLSCNHILTNTFLLRMRNDDKETGGEKTTTAKFVCVFKRKTV
jgi:hypothetical protein